MAKLYIGNTAYKVMLGNNSGHFMRGVYQNTTNNTFISRQTGGGNLTIDATNGKVLKVEGNSVAWNQLVNYNKDNIHNGIRIQGNGRGLVNIVVSNATGYYQVPISTLKGIYGHKYLITGNDRSNGFNVYFYLSPESDNTNYIVTCGGNNVDLYLFVRKTVPNGSYTKHIKCIDLTLLNYPNIATTTPTVAQVEEWLANNVELKDYYPYDKGSILNVKMLGIKTTLPNTWTETKDFDVTRVYGKLNGKGSYVQIYPDGMRGVNDVKDVLYLNEDRAEVKYIKKELNGTEDYVNFNSYIHTDNSDMFTTLFFGNGTNFICNKFAYVPTVWPSNKEGACINGKQFHISIANSKTGVVYGTDTAGSAKNKLIAWVKSQYDNGTPIIANIELATPLTYTNLMYDQSQANDGSDLIPLSVLTYRVDANGTEEIIRPTSVNGEPTSLAPTMDIKYINANIK